MASSSKREEEKTLIGESPAFLAALEEASLVAPLSKPVLVVGERGTGKELVAERIHFLSRRWDQPFIKLNCAALSESLLETELFGHEAGSFTGASKLHRGRFELADKGSLFLDELATMSVRVQEKLLRVIEYGEFERVGGTRQIKTDVRIIAATNMDLPALAAAGKFREDLLDRLAFDVITLPPVRNRTEDILPLADFFARRMISELERPFFPGFSAAARDALMAYAWPGNVRELRNVVERAVYRSREPEEVVSEINFDPFESPYRPPPVAPKGKPDSTADSTVVVDTGGNIDFLERTRKFEIELINRAMEGAKYNQRKAAEDLGLSYHQLRGYLRKYDLLK